MDWNDYRKEIDEAGFSPDAPRRAALRALAEQEGKERHMMKATRRPLRTSLIAACVAAVLVVSAMAAAISWNKTIREDLGIGEDPIPGYHEYEGGTEKAEGMTLVAAVCSGQRMDAYVTVCPIEKDAELTLLPQAGEKNPVTSLVDQLDYDPETRTALVRVTVMSDSLPDMDALEVALRWFEEPSEDPFAGALELPRDENGEPVGLEEYVDDRYADMLSRYEHFFGPVRVPVTESELLAASCNVPLACGNVQEIRVGAGIVEICMDPHFPETDDPHAATLAQMEAINAALADASITYTDGRTENVSTLPSRWASPWVYANGDPNSCRVQHLTSQMLNLREVESITLGGVTVPVK